MLDQAEELRRLAETQKNRILTNKINNKPKTVIITVTSGKGGVGKSNFVVNMAICLQKMKKKVLIFDADIGMGNDDVLMGFLPKYSVYDVIFENKSLEDVIIRGPFGIKLLPGGTGFPRFNEVSKKQRDDFIDKLSKIEGFDYIIIDTGAGINKIVMGFIACCEELFIITTPEPTSLTDAYSLIKAVNYFNIKEKANVIVNRVTSIKEGENTFNKFNKVVHKFLNISLNYLGYILEDKKITQAVKNQVPFVINYPTSYASKNVNYMAQKLLGAENIKKQNGIQDLFKKIFDIFS
ncbi:flagellar biosynthesis protein FlhG [Clostridium algifaecis]|uniref:Flagellar biosynthesis protein FlhG n=1 Tax=Clostridium algifaecis TaxID=1472040 RepID=A0ABS4KMY9_9CLOT|nr:MinD/ParA family protein [Clostridium algifaecis]MBP2031395.1 flagellar biosynthesis protein FlhG [Clostridium algifaecis]